MSAVSERLVTRLTLALGPVIIETAAAHLRDPSAILFHAGRYHCWATRVTPPTGKPEGYRGQLWHFTAESVAGPWQDAGVALRPSTQAADFDRAGVFTGDVTYDPAAGRWYLFYTGVNHGFTNAPSVAGFSPTAIGVAMAASPDGPWERSRHNPIVVTGPTPWNGLRVDEATPFWFTGQRRLYVRGVKLVAAEPFTRQQLLGLSHPVADSWDAPYRLDERSPLVAGPRGERGFEGYAFFPGPDGLLHLLAVNPIEGPLDAVNHFVSHDGMAWQWVESIRVENATGTLLAPHPIWNGATPGREATVTGFVTQTKAADGRMGIALLRHRWVNE